jgi:hypothetical protein
MHIASRLKLLALAVSIGFASVATAAQAADYSYIPSNLSVTMTSAQGQKQNLSFQQGGKLASIGSNTNNLLVDFADTGAFGLSEVAVIDTTDATVTTCASCGEPVEVNASVNQSAILNGTVTLNNYSNDLVVTASAGDKAPYTVSDTVNVNVVATGVSIPTGTYSAGTKFDISTPVSVTVGSATESDNFVGKIVLGQLKPIYGWNGQVSGTRVIEMKVVGKITDSAGNVYAIDHNFGETNLNGILPSQVTFQYSLVQAASSN